LTPKPFDLPASNRIVQRDLGATLLGSALLRRSLLRIGLVSLTIVLAILLDLCGVVLSHVISRTRLALVESPIAHLRVTVKVHDGLLNVALETLFSFHIRLKRDCA